MNDSPPLPNVQGHPSSVDAYIRHKWSLVPLPPNTKGPSLKNWNVKGNQLRNAADLPAGYGIGLAHAYSGTMALDVDDWAQAAETLDRQGIDLHGLYQAKDAVTIESGRQGHGKLLYAMPFGIVLPSKKLISVHADGSRSNYLDFRCATAQGLTVQDVLPPSIHPDTKQSYRWGGAGTWTRLPLMPPALLDYWRRLLERDASRAIPAGSEVDASWDDIRSALAAIPPDVSRGDWIAIGMALHWAGTQTSMPDDAFEIWDAWSAGPPGRPSTKYQGASDLMTSWRGFNPDNGITLGTLFHLARSYGWLRPVPPASEIFAQLASGQTPSAPVDVLAGFRPPPPAPDLSQWPRLLATRAQEVATSVGCDPLVPLFAGLSALCGAVDAQARLELAPGFQVPPVLWCMTIGAPADKKTPGSFPMVEHLFQIEKDGREAWKPKMLEWEVQEAAYKDAKELYFDHYKNPLNHVPNMVGPELPELPEMPIPPKVVVQDITSQKLVRHCANHPRGLLCYLDEMSAWAKKTSDPRASDDRSAWVVSYESRRYEMDRMGTGTSTAENYAVSIYGNIQPKAFRKYVNVLSEDGLLQRFIPVILRPASTTKGAPIPDIFSHKSQWDALLGSVYQSPAQTYHLTPEARRAFSDFQDYALARQQDERIIGTDDNFQTALGKITGTCGRLALVFHLIESPTSPLVSWDTMIRAIHVVKGYIIPALRYTFTELAGARLGLDEWLVSHLLAVSGEYETVTLTDLRLAARGILSDLPLWHQVQAVKDAATLLEKCNWLRCVEDRPSHQHILWAINPTLASTYKDYRQRVAEIRERIHNENREGLALAKAAGFACE